MADNAAFNSPKGKGPNWLLIGGAGAAVLGVIVLVTRNTGSSNGSTTAAGSSINAALGSLQEEQMNLLGNVQAGALMNTANFQATSGQITDSTNAILQALSDQGTSIQTEITGATNTINANTNAGNQNLLSAISDALAKITSGETNILSQVQSVQQQVSTVGNQVTGVSGQVSQLAGNVASNASQAQANYVAEIADLMTLISDATSTQATAAQIDNWTNEIKARLQQGDYSSPFHGPSYKPWTTASSPLAA